MESNATKLHNLFSLVIDTHKDVDSDKKICENYFQSQSKQGSVASMAFTHLQKQFKTSGYFCGVLNRRIGLLGGEASHLMREDTEVMAKFEAIVEKLSNKTYRKTSLYDYANVDEGHTSEAKREILEMEKFAKTLETMKLTIQTIMSALTKIYNTWSSLWNEITLIIINPADIFGKSVETFQLKVNLEITYDRAIESPETITNEQVDEFEKDLKPILDASRDIKLLLEKYQMKEEKFKAFFNQGNNLNDFFRFYLEDCLYFYRITNQLAVKLNAHYYGFSELFGTIRDNTAKYTLSLDAFDKWAEEYERKTESIKEMQLMIQEFQKKFKEMTQKEVEKREMFEKEYAKYLPGELMVECPIPEIEVYLKGKPKQKKRSTLRECEGSIYQSHESSYSQTESYSRSYSHSDSDSLNDELLSNS